MFYILQNVKLIPTVMGLSDGFADLWMTRIVSVPSLPV